MAAALIPSLDNSIVDLCLVSTVIDSSPTILEKLALLTSNISVIPSFFKSSFKSKSQSNLKVGKKPFTSVIYPSS